MYSTQFQNKDWEDDNMKKYRLGRIIFSLVVLLLSGCYGGAASSPTPTGAGNVNGNAFLNALNGSTTSLFAVNNDGSSILPALEVVTTAPDGSFAFTSTPQGPFRVCVTGGTYTDEASGKLINNTLPLCGLFPAGTTNIVLTMLTTFADEIAKAALGQLAAPTPADIAAQLAAAADQVRAFFGLMQTAEKVMPLFTPPDAVKDPTGDRYKLAAILGAYSQLALTYFNTCGAIPGEEQAILPALIQDIRDGVFDGKSLDQVFAAIQVLAQCGGANQNLGKGAGTADLLTAFDAFTLTAQGTVMNTGGNKATTDTIKTAVANSPLAPVAVRVTPSQGLIAIDGVRNVAYVPIYTLSGAGDGQVAVVDLDPANANPVLSIIALPGSTRAVASALNPLTRLVYIEGRTPASGVEIYIVNADTDLVLGQLPATGLTHNGNFGGILVNPQFNKAVVAGSSQISLMDISVNPPIFDAASIVTVRNTDSISLNFETQVLFVASDGTNSVFDTTVSPPVKRTFPSTFGTTDGNAFDNLTNTLIVDPEFVDHTTVCNFNELALTTATTSTAPCMTVQGILSPTGPFGEGPGGQAAINVLTHQAVIADEFGHNIRLMQLPTAAYIGAPNNNGQPGSATVADAASAYSIATTQLPLGDVNPVDGTGETQLGLRGDPNALTIDPSRNIAYGLADTVASFNAWPTGSTRPLFLLQMDLSAPVLGASPTEATGLRWNPTSRLIRMP